MKFWFPIILFVLCNSVSLSQNQIELYEGTISYITTQSVYVRFESTEHIEAGDSLYIRREGKLVPALEVKNISSISCVCVNISAISLKEKDVVFAKRKPNIIPNEVTVTKDAVQLTVTPEIVKNDTIDKGNDDMEFKQDINGHLSVSSYSNFSNSPASNL